ncbi:MAG: hypothetical protein L3J39_01105 [Verrucomicrobiales bacterium]|nr:hypothetical protein [Verrucomicrobiales bacterium]
MIQLERLSLIALQIAAQLAGGFAIVHDHVGESIAEGFEVVEFPDQFFVAVHFDDLRIVWACVAVADDKIAVVEFL